MSETLPMIIIENILLYYEDMIQTITNIEKFHFLKYHIFLRFYPNLDTDMLCNSTLLIQMKQMFVNSNANYFHL